MTTFTREIKFRPAFDRRDPDPRKNYGIHGMEICFVLQGPEGGITYTIYTHWMLPHVQKELDAKHSELFRSPVSAGLDGHWKVPQYEGQPPMKNCQLTGGDCYCDGTALTDDVFQLLVREGEEAVWKLMESRYEAWRPK